MLTTLSKVKNSSFLNNDTTSNQLETNDVSMAFMTEAHVTTD